MKVILLENVKKVGNKDDIVEVSHGYGYNFLIKNKKAVEATEVHLKQLNEKIAENQKKHDQDVEEAKKVKLKIEKEVFKFSLNKGNNGNVFGKVSSKQISKTLKEKGYNIERKDILTDGVGHLGEETIKVKIHKEVEADVKIEIIGE